METAKAGDPRLMTQQEASELAASNNAGMEWAAWSSVELVCRAVAYPYGAAAQDVIGWTISWGPVEEERSR